MKKQRAFIVKIMLDEGIDPQTVAQDLHEATIDEGYDVISVVPWTAPTDALTQASSVLGAAELNPQDVGLGVPGLGLDSLKL